MVLQARDRRATTENPESEGRGGFSCAVRARGNVNHIGKLSSSEPMRPLYISINTFLRLSLFSNYGSFQRCGPRPPSPSSRSASSLATTPPDLGCRRSVMISLLLSSAVGTKLPMKPLLRMHRYQRPSQPGGPCHHGRWSLPKGLFPRRLPAIPSSSGSCSPS